MTMPAEDYEPVRVAVVADHTAAKPAPHEGHRMVYQTFVLSSDEPCQTILPQSRDRVIAYVQALDNDIVIGPDKSTVSAATNTVASTPHPSGALIPKANTTPYPVDDSDFVWAGATTTSSTSRVVVTAVYRK